MIIRGREYGFALTVGAKLALGDMVVSGKNLEAKTYINMSIVMSKAYEDIQKLDNPEYERHPLERVIVESMTEEQFKELCKELDRVALADSTVTVKTEPIKSKKK